MRRTWLGAQPVAQLAQRSLIPSAALPCLPTAFVFSPSVSTVLLHPPNPPAAFQWDDFAAKNNAELNDNLGNFINRTLKFIWAR